MSVRRYLASLTVVGLATSLGGARLSAQQSPSPSASAIPDVGQIAPDFTLPAGSRYGLLQSPFHLADHRGETVVLAFFPKARTKG